MTQLIDSVSPPGSPPTDKLSVLRPFCLLCTAALLCSCSSGLGRLHGKIIDAGDAAPPPDVIVVAARWLVDDLPMPRVHPCVRGFGAHALRCTGPVSLRALLTAAQASVETNLSQ